MEQIESNKTDKPIEKRLSPETILDNGNINSQISAEPKNVIINNYDTQGQSRRKDSSDSSVSTENNNVKGVRSSQKFGNQSYANKSNGEKSHNQLSNNHNAHVVSTSNPNEMQNFPANQITAKSNGFATNHNSKVVNSINPSIPSSSAIVSRNMRPTSGPPPLPSSHHPSNLSYLVQHVMPPLYSVQCGTPNTPPPPIYHNTFFSQLPPWSLYDDFERHHNKVNMNMQPKNFVMSGRTGMTECRQACRGRLPPSNSPDNPSIGTNNFIPHPFNMNGAWIKPTIYYDGFWTEQKVKKWVTDQTDKSTIMEEVKVPNPVIQKQMCHSKV